MREWEKGWPHTLSWSTRPGNAVRCHCIDLIRFATPGGVGIDTSGFGGTWRFLRGGAARRHSVPVGLFPAHAGRHQTTRTGWFFIQANLKQVSNLVVLNIFFHANKEKKVQFPAWVRFSCFRLATPAPLSPSGTHQRWVTHTSTHVLIKVSLHVAPVTSSFFFLYIFLFFSILTMRWPDSAGPSSLRGLSCLHALWLWVRGSHVCSRIADPLQSVPIKLLHELCHQRHPHCTTTIPSLLIWS